MRILFSFLVVVFTLNANAANLSFKEGVHFSKLEKPLPQGVSPIVEFFYYGCETCAKLAPAVAQWAAENKLDISLVPVHSKNDMVDEARIFHTFEVIGALDKMYYQGFEMVQSKTEKLQGVERVNTYLKKNGIAPDVFWAAWKSPHVEKLLEGSAALSMQAKVMRTPTFVVSGIYKANIESIKGGEELFQLLEYLLKLKVEPVAPRLLAPVSASKQ